MAACPSSSHTKSKSHSPANGCKILGPLSSEEVVCFRSQRRCWSYRSVEAGAFQPEGNRDDKSHISKHGPVYRYCASSIRAANQFKFYSAGNNSSKFSSIFAKHNHFSERGATGFPH